MILADNSIWVGHLRKGNDSLALFLRQGRIVTHPFVIGELACGSMANRKGILRLLEALPGIGMAGHAEVLHLIDEKHLHDQGIGWIDAHLLASALLAQAWVWTSGRGLLRAAAALGISL